MTEHWKQIANYPNYEASDLGNIRNRKTGRILRPGRQSNGYMIVSIRENGKSLTRTVHRLVAETWMPKKTYDNLVVNHKNYNKADNRLDNLEWCTYQENVLKGSGPTELNVLKSMLFNALNVALNEWYDRLLTLKCSKDTFTEEVVKNAVKDAVLLLDK